jgi:lysyl-tRNA synthetase class 1
MFWADRIVEEIKNTEAAKKATKEKPLIVRDEKTLSGRVHIGSMRGVAIHGLITELLNDAGVPTIFRYELNDFDPLDTVPGYLDQEKFKEYLGMPLYKVPSPEPGFENYAEYYGAEFVSVHKKAGFEAAEYYRLKDLYQSGKMDSFIKTALERKDDIRRILKEVSGSSKDESWLPVSIVCERCGKMMTTRAYDFDGETVAYTCDRSPDGTVPCQNTGRISPYSGNAKLFWKVDWAAKWIANGVDVEGAGKDHSTKGGSRDVANHVAREVYGHEPPFDAPYEFFLVGGKKMSSSKGKGSSAKDMADLFPPELLRLILIGKDMNQQIDVDPEGDSIPRTYDWYDDLAEKVREGVEDDFTRLYELCQIPGTEQKQKAPWQLRFSQVAFIMQMPHMDLEKEAEALKESPLTHVEKEKLAERASYAKFWLAAYAPEEFRYQMQEIMPAVELSDTQKKACAVLAEYFAEQRTGEEVHKRLHNMKTEIPIQPKELFAGLYQIFLGRDSGPKAGWFLSSLPRDFVQERLRQAAT